MASWGGTTWLAGAQASSPDVGMPCGRLVPLILGAGLGKEKELPAPLRNQFPSKVQRPNLM